MNYRHRLPALVLGAALAASSCTTSNENVCEDMESWLDNRARELDRSCETDDDCRVVYVRPDEPVAASAYTEDAFVRRLRRDFSEECAEALYGSGVEFIPDVDARVSAECRDEIGEQFTAEGSSIEYIIGRSCALVGTFLPAPRLDAGMDDADPADTCSCASNAECAPGRCVGCSCVDAGPCATICDRAFACGATDSLNLGTTGAACAEACEARVAGDSTFDLTGASQCAEVVECESLADCF